MRRSADRRRAEGAPGPAEPPPSLGPASTRPPSAACRSRMPAMPLLPLGASPRSPRGHHNGRQNRALTAQLDAHSWPRLGQRLLHHSESGGIHRAWQRLQIAAERTTTWSPATLARFTSSSRLRKLADGARGASSPGCRPLNMQLNSTSTSLLACLWSTPATAPAGRPSSATPAWTLIRRCVGENIVQFASDPEPLLACLPSRLLRLRTPLLRLASLIARR